MIYSPTIKVHLDKIDVVAKSIFFAIETEKNRKLNSSEFIFYITEFPY